MNETLSLDDLKQKNFMLTTFDNPFNPFEEFSIWWKTDHLLGHNCCEILARNSMTSDYFSDERNEELIAEAALDIVRREPMIYKIVFPLDYPRGSYNVEQDSGGV